MVTADMVTAPLWHLYLLNMDADDDQPRSPLHPPLVGELCVV